MQFFLQGLPNFRPHTDGKGDDAYFEGSEGNEVPKLVKEDETAQNQYYSKGGIPVGKDME